MNTERKSPKIVTEFIYPPIPLAPITAMKDPK